MTTSDGTRIDFVPAPNPPDEPMLQRLREAFSVRPRIQEAWVLGQRITLPDETRPREQSVIALILDPPVDPDDRLSSFTALAEELKDQSGWSHGWQTTHKMMIGHYWDGAAARIYSKPAADT